jgi:hypothetical protein
MGKADSLIDPVKLRFLISTRCPSVGHRQGSPVFIVAWLLLRVAARANLDVASKHKMKLSTLSYSGEDRSIYPDDNYQNR